MLLSKGPNVRGFMPWSSLRAGIVVVNSNSAAICK
jgi:hypothetical protein